MFVPQNHRKLLALSALGKREEEQGEKANVRERTDDPREGTAQRFVYDVCADRVQVPLPVIA